MDNVTLHNRDCLEVMKELPSESVDLFITDCPYRIIGGGCTTGPYGNVPRGILNRNERERERERERKTKHVNLGGIFNEDNPAAYAKQGKLFKHNDIDFSEWLPDTYRVLKEQTHAYIMVNARNLKDLQQKAEDVGFEFQQLLIWDKGNSCPNKYYLNAFECILMLRKGMAKNINNLGTTNILRVPNIRGNKQHPTEKPVTLMRIMVENSSNKGEVVLDPFMGAGATGIACKQTGRKFIGCEIDERYFEIAEQRIIQGKLRKETEQMSLF